jgi:hypothetical protein
MTNLVKKMEISQPDKINLPQLKLEVHTFARMRDSVEKLVSGFEDIYREAEDAIAAQIQENDDELSALTVKKMNPKL